MPDSQYGVSKNLRQLLSRLSRTPISLKGGATDDIEPEASLIISPPPISTSTPQICDRPQSQPAGPLRHRDQHGDHKEGMTRVGIDLAFTPRLLNQNSCRYSRSIIQFPIPTCEANKRNSNLIV